MYDELAGACRALAGLCDGAAVVDQQGFNKFDTRFGKAMANKNPGDWTDREARAVWSMLRKYKNQLSGHGIVWGDFAVPTVAPAEPRELSALGITSRQAPTTRTIDVQFVEKFRKDAFVIRFPYIAVLVDAVKALPNRRFINENNEKFWSLGVDVYSLPALVEFAMEHDFDVSVDARTVMEDALASFEYNKTASIAADADIQIDGLGGELRPFQRGGVAYAIKVLGYDRRYVETVEEVLLDEPVPTPTVSSMFESRRHNTAPTTLFGHKAPASTIPKRTEKRVTGHWEVTRNGGRSGCFIADDMGLGKTVQALALLHALNMFTALIVCPASLKRNWEREARKWIPNARVSVINSNQPVRWQADIFIINYDILGDGWNDAKNADGTVKKNSKGKVVKEITLSSVAQHLYDMGLRAVVMDEFHYVKQNTAQRSAACRKLAASADIKIGLTGTPVKNRPVELVSQLEILDCMDIFGNSWKFMQRYCGAEQGSYGWNMDGATNLGELNEKLRSSCMVRRLKKDVLTELPPKQRTTLDIPLSNRKEYDVAKANIVKWIRNHAEPNEAFLETLAGLSPEEQVEAIDQYRSNKSSAAESCEALVKIEALKQLAAIGKLKAIKEWIDDFLESGEKLVLFAYHTAVCKKFAAEFGAPIIIGETSLDARQRAVDRFQDDPSCKIIVGNINAMGVGLTLTSASNVAFVEFGWNPADMDQAEDRCHRMGQTDSVNCWYLVGTDTIDEDIVALIDSKRSVVNAATDGTDQTGQKSIFNELLRKLKG